MFRIEFAEGVTEDLRGVRAFDRARLLDTIERQLAHEPLRETKNKKVIVGLVSPWRGIEPIWELRCGAFRVFYDVDEESSVVIVRAIRLKPPHRTTEEIL